MRNENILKRERLDARDAMRPLVNKLGRRERLSAEEAQEMARITESIDRIDRDLLDLSEGRALSENASRPGDDYSPGTEDRAFSDYLRSGNPRGLEARAAGEGTGSQGGFLVPPGWWQRLQIALKAYGGIANDFTQLETDTGQTMAWANSNPTSTAASLIAENTQLSSVDYTFGQGTMGAYMYANGIQLVSRQLAQDSAFDLDNFVQTRCGEALGRAQSAAAVNGTGSSQPLGIYPALNAGGAVSGQNGGGFVALTAAKGVNVFGTTGTVPAGTVFNQSTELASGALAPQTVNQIISSIDPAYRKLGAKFYMCDQTLISMRNVVDGFGRPLYTEILDDSAPKLRGYDVVIDNNLSPLSTAAVSGPVFGHAPSAMVLRSVKGGSVLRLEERYADFLQVGYIGYMRFDIRSNDLRAMVAVKPAAT